MNVILDLLFDIVGNPDRKEDRSLIQRFEKDQNIIRWKSGSVTDFVTGELPPSSWSAVRTDLFAIDEQAASSAHWDQAVLRCVQGGLLINTFTEGQDQDSLSFVRSRILMNDQMDPEDPTKPLVWHIHAKLTDNPWISGAAIERARRLVSSKAAAGMLLDAEGIPLGSIPFPSLNENLIIPDIPKEEKSGLIFLSSLDWQDKWRQPQAMVLGALSKTNVLYIFDQIFTDSIETMVQQYWAKMPEKAYVNIADINCFTASSLTGRSVRDVLASKEYGIHLIPAKKGKGSIGLSVQAVERRLQRGKMFFLENARFTYNVMKECYWGDWASARLRDTLPDKGRLISKNLHIVDACKMLCLALDPRHGFITYRAPEDRTPRQPIPSPLIRLPGRNDNMYIDRLMIERDAKSVDRLKIKTGGNS